MPLTAADIMTRDVITAGPDASVAAIAKLLNDHSISAVPVCDARGKLLGMISEGDLMRPFGAEHALKRAWWLNVLAEGTDLAPIFLDYIRLDQRCARDLMTTPVITAPEDANLHEVADLLAGHRIKRVTIVRDGRPVGIVSRTDLVRVMARLPDAIAEPA
jgi:CBS domain-containing protein